MTDTEFLGRQGQLELFHHDLVAFYREATRVGRIVYRTLDEYRDSNAMVQEWFSEDYRELLEKIVCYPKQVEPLLLGFDEFQSTLVKSARRSQDKNVRLLSGATGCVHELATSTLIRIGVSLRCLIPIELETQEWFTIEDLYSFSTESMVANFREDVGEAASKLKLVTCDQLRNERIAQAMQLECIGAFEIMEFEELREAERRREEKLEAFMAASQQSLAASAEPGNESMPEWVEELTGRPGQLVRYLWKRKTKKASFAELHDDIWNDKPVQDDAIRRAITRAKDVLVNHYCTLSEKEGQVELIDLRK